MAAHASGKFVLLLSGFIGFKNLPIFNINIFSLSSFLFGK